MKTFKGSTFQTINADGDIQILVTTELDLKHSYEHILSIGDKEFSYEEALKIKNYLISNVPDKSFTIR